MSTIKRVLISLAILAVCVVGAAWFVGGDIIPAEAGLVIWLIGIILAVVAFVRTKPKA